MHPMTQQEHFTIDLVSLILLQTEAVLYILLKLSGVIEWPHRRFGLC